MSDRDAWSRDRGAGLGGWRHLRADGTADSLPGDFVVWDDWAEYFCGMWRDLLFIDSGTGDIRSLILYGVPSRRRVLGLDGAGLGRRVGRQTRSEKGR